MLEHDCKACHCDEQALPERCEHFSLWDERESSWHPYNYTCLDLSRIFRIQIAEIPTEITYRPAA